MSNDLTDEELVNAFVARTSRHSLREAGDLAGVSHGTVDRWRKGRVASLQPATRRALEDFLDAGVENGDGRQVAEYPDGGIAAAEQIIETFGRPEALRRQAGHIPAKDAAIAGYALGQRLQLPPAGMRRIMEWHDAIMEGEGEGD